MQAHVPLLKDLVFVGGGHTHALVLRSFAMRPLSGVRLTVVNPGPDAPYSGMLPGFVAGHYTREELDIDLVRLARMAGARLIMGRVEGIDRTAQTLHIAGRPPVGYDIASLDIGITSEMPDLPGFATHAHPAKPLGAFGTAWERFTTSDRAQNIAIIGGGVAGVELALSMAFRLRKTPDAQITLLEAGSEILRDTLPGTRAVLRQRLQDLRVQTLTGARPAEISGEGVLLEDGRLIQAGFVTGSAVALPQTWITQTGLVHECGFVVVDPMLRSSDPSIYAVGDCAHMAHAPRPKAGVYAVRQAPILDANLRGDLTGTARRRYQPQKGYLKLISMGDKTAVADKFGITVRGASLWRLKDRIDTNFMEQFRSLRPMQPPAPLGEAVRGVATHLSKGPLCAGCGGKVAPDALRAGLATALKPSITEHGTVPGDDAAILPHTNGQQVFTVDHLSALWADPYVFGRIAAVHALGDIWAMGAKPQTALITALLPALSEPLQQRMLTELLAGLSSILEDAGATISGGHSATAAELSVGVSLTGLVETPITLRGARPGDVLVLTKPLGTGILMAAEMRGKLRGRDMVSALSSMQRPLAKEAQLLAKYAHAMTDVTGFGLAGHLAGFAVAAELFLDRIPMLPGAVELAKTGLRSSLYDANRRAAPVTGADGPRASLLHDPQTAGGLLAAIPEDKATELMQTCPDMRIIGKVLGGPPKIILA